MPKSINLTGTPGRKYNLDTLADSNTRMSSSEDLVVQIWYWNPDGLDMYKNSPAFEDHRKPNPPQPKIGQIWLSKLVPSSFTKEE